MKHTRHVYFDVLRIIAIFLVLFNHQPAYKLYFRETGIAECFALLEAIIVRINVPLFAMISGALLLGRTETLRQIWDKRISRILIVLTLFSPLLYLELGWLRDHPLSFTEFFYGFFANTIKGQTSYWFLYAYLGFLLMLPFLRKVAQTMTHTEFLWLVGIHVFFSTVIPLSSFLLQLFQCNALIVTGSLSVSLATVGLMFYPLIGYYINEHVDVYRITRRMWCMLLFLCLACSIITALVVFVDGKAHKFTQNYLGLFYYVNIIVVFLIIKRLFGTSFAERHIRLSRAITFVGSLTFGIYLLDLAVQLPIYEPIKAAVMPRAGAFFFTLLWCIISFALGGMITYILKQIPFFKKLL